jgi:hypothetical protein
MASGDKSFVHSSGRNTIAKDGKPVAKEGAPRATSAAAGNSKASKAKPNRNMATEVEGDQTLPQMQCSKL